MCDGCVGYVYVAEAMRGPTWADIESLIATKNTIISQPKMIMGVSMVPLEFKITPDSSHLKISMKSAFFIHFKGGKCNFLRGQKSSRIIFQRPPTDMNVWALSPAITLSLF